MPFGGERPPRRQSARRSARQREYPPGSGRHRHAVCDAAELQSGLWPRRSRPDIAAEIALDPAPQLPPGSIFTIDRCGGKMCCRIQQGTGRLRTGNSRPRNATGPIQPARKDRRALRRRPLLATAGPAVRFHRISKPQLEPRLVNERLNCAPGNHGESRRSGHPRPWFRSGKAVDFQKKWPVL